MVWLKRNTPTDTGTLNIGGLATGMTAGTWTLRRVGNLVYMTLADAEFTPTSGSMWGIARIIPSGFQPPAVPSYAYFPSSPSRAGDSGAGLRISRYGGVGIYDIAGKKVSTSCTWVTDDPWPTSLPGVS